MAIVRWDGERATRSIDPLAIDNLDGDVLVIDHVTETDDHALGWVRRAPCVVVGIAPSGARTSTAVDVAVSETDAGLDDLLNGIEKNPQACRVLVDVLRAMPDLDVPTGLTLESLAYSTLLAGPEFARWLDTRRERRDRTFADPPVRVERDGASLHITLARPENRNAFSAQMRDGLFEALSLAEVDASIDRVLIDSDGPVFSSGGDLTEFGSTPDVVRAHHIRTQRSIGALLTRLHPRVTVHVHGTCVGAGIELPAFAAQVVADEDTTFRLPEIAMGLIPGAGGTVSLTRRIGRQHTARLAITGTPINVTEALDLGLVDAVGSSNGTSNGSADTASHGGPQAYTPNTGNPSSATRSGTRRHRPTRPRSDS